MAYCEDHSWNMSALFLSPCAGHKVAETKPSGTLFPPCSPCYWLQPLRVPGFAFAWLELMSQRKLMPKLLLAPNHKGWPSFQRLLLALLRFLEPYLRNAELTDAVRLLYKVSPPL